jgi:glycine cleavage system H protein
MQIDKYTFPDGLLFDKEHNWALVEGKTVTQGLTDFGQKLAGEIVYAEVPRLGREVKQGEPFMSMESGKWVGRVKAIVSGKIVGVNQEIEWESTTINHDPYGAGWLVKIELNNPADTGALLKPDSPAFGEFIAAERKKYGK